MLCVPELFESYSILFLVMADVPELHLVPNRCGIWSNSVALNVQHMFRHGKPIRQRLYGLIR
ncbi:hypothetical protein T09_14250 [Trichinella sp. T9]|nr:hypothetical protein T09_14250 [Trichinella sp. T9]